jgi:hypothetical protein
LIAWQHPIEAIWEMTPRQVFAWMTLGLDREKVERAERLGDAFSAARGDPEKVERTFRELSGG